MKRKVHKPESFVLSTSVHRSVALPPKIKGSKDFGKKINLMRLFETMKGHCFFVPNYDLDSNPSQSFVNFKVEGLGSFNVYETGSCTCGIKLEEDATVSLLDAFYKIYVRPVLYGE